MVYIQYTKKEQNTTVGMPKLAPVEPVNGESTDTDDNKHILTEDVYAFIVVAPVASKAFLFALYVILLKYLVYAIILSSQRTSALLESDTVNQKVVKFLLIPVAIAMQDDLIHVYACAANTQYDEKVLEVSHSATKGKLIFSFLLRFFDGFASLSVNFYVMLLTHDGGVLSVFLNFAALHFLQSIDDVFFKLVMKGFFGDVMEHMSRLCTEVTFPRRITNIGCVKQLDTILLFLTLLLCIAIFGTMFV